MAGSITYTSFRITNYLLGPQLNEGTFPWLVKYPLRKACYSAITLLGIAETAVRFFLYIPFSVSRWRQAAHRQFAITYATTARSYARAIPFFGPEPNKQILHNHWLYLAWKGEMTIGDALNTAKFNFDNALRSRDTDGMRRILTVNPNLIDRWFAIFTKANNLEGLTAALDAGGDPNRNNLIKIALEGSAPEIVLLLLERGVERVRKQDFEAAYANRRDELAGPLLFIALKKKDKDKVINLLDINPSPNTFPGGPYRMLKMLLAYSQLDIMRVTTLIHHPDFEKKGAAKIVAEHAPQDELLTLLQALDPSKDELQESLAATDDTAKKDIIQRLITRKG